MTAKKVFEKGMEEMKNVNYGEVFTHLSLLNTGAWNDVLDTKRCGYYQWLSALMQALRPHQVVELGGAMGVGTLMMLATPPKKCQIYSITLPEHGLEFSYINKDYPNLIKIVGNDLDMSNWPRDMDWKKTDILFIDTSHTEQQLRKEISLYFPLLKKGTIVLLDDIHLNEGMNKVWEELPNNKYDATNPLHWSGYGIATI